jgi:hypothetical protein
MMEVDITSPFIGPGVRIAGVLFYWFRRRRSAGSFYLIGYEL